MIPAQACQELEGVCRAALGIMGGAAYVEHPAIRAAGDASEGESPDAGTGEEGGGSGAGATLEDAARGEREYVRKRVRVELGREPTEGEVDEWLREHTEGY
jgi:hypothetical protein